MFTQPHKLGIITEEKTPNRHKANSGRSTTIYSISLKKLTLNET